MKVKQYREVDFATALYEQTHKGAVVQTTEHGNPEKWIQAPCSQMFFWTGKLDAYTTWKFRIVTEVDDPYAELKAAHAAGKVIQYKSSSGVWSDVTPSWCVEPARYRIKPEPKYRPWRTVDEVPVGSLATHTDRQGGRNRGALSARDNSQLIIYIGAIFYTPDEVLEFAKLADGSPCGVLEDAQ